MTQTERDALLAEVRRMIAAERRTLLGVLGHFAEGAGKHLRGEVAKAEGSTLDLLSDLEQRITRLEQGRRK